MGKLHFSIKRKFLTPIVFLFLFGFFINPVNAKGYIVDLRENNPTYQERFDKFQLVFDLDKNTVAQLVIVSKKYRKNISLFQEIKREHNIVAIEDDGITLEESYRNFLDYAHRTYLDDDFLVGSKWYNKKYKKLVEESGGLDAPYHRIKLNLDTLEFIETINPLTKKAKTYKESFAYDPDSIRKKDQAEKFIKAAIFVATIYLIINHLDDINEIQEKTRTAKSPSSSTKTLTSNIQNNSPYKPITTLDSWKWGQNSYWTGPITGHKAKEFVVMRSALLRRYVIYGY